MSYCFRAEDTPRAEDEVFECCDHPKCPHCHGSGEVRFTRYQHEMSLSGSAGQFIVMFTGDGSFDYCGRVEAKDVPSILEQMKAKWGPDSDMPFVQKMYEIFTWAAENEKDVTWG